MKNFAIIGAAGYVAPRHMNAIKETGNCLVAAIDPNDSVGVLDKYFPDADFFTEFERFDRHLEKLKREGRALDYLVICSPNYLHDSHIRYGLRIGANVICEKPIVLNPWNVEALRNLESDYSGRIYNILQLRLHPAVVSLKEEVSNTHFERKFKVDLNYITSRGKWYDISWKGDVAKSGGIATNIGIHFFDMLLWIFGSVEENKVISHTNKRASGELILEKAEVKWNLSIDSKDLPLNISEKGDTTYRALSINGNEFNFSEGFEDLHTLSYSMILKDEGFGVQEVADVIDLVYQIRKSIEMNN